MVVIPKPNKPDYSNPKAYRPIALLNCLGKVLEKLMASRLSGMAEPTTSYTWTRSEAAPNDPPSTPPWPSYMMSKWAVANASPRPPFSSMCEGHLKTYDLPG
jgi:hypothetical protein